MITIVDHSDLYRCLCIMAESWHWPGLQQEEKVIPDALENTKRPTVIRWWYGGDYDDVALQITENPPWYAGVYAWRYRIFTGWHYFRPYRAKARQVAEAARLGDFVDFGNFSSREGRRWFRKRHPECARYTWKRYQREGPPYDFRSETGASWASLRAQYASRANLSSK
jgi:hypothetical protein